MQLAQLGRQAARCQQRQSAVQLQLQLSCSAGKTLLSMRPASRWQGRLLPRPAAVDRCGAPGGEHCCHRSPTSKL